MIAVLALVALLFWTWGVLGFVHWFIQESDRRRDAAFRADQLVAQARAEVQR